jgi:methyl-accepting chemotaxis protein
MKLEYKVAIAPILSAILFVIFGFIAFNTLRTLQINGNLYNQIIEGKDVIADVLPPPEYIIEAFLVTYQISTEEDQAKRDELCSRLKDLKDLYMVQHNHWDKTLKKSKLRDVLVTDSYTPSIEFFKIAEEQLIPAAKSNNLKLASEIVNGPLKRHYNVQRKAVDEVVKLATARNADDTKLAEKIIHSRSIVMTSALVGGTLLMLASTVIASLSIRKIMAPVAMIARMAERMSKGDLSSRIRLKGRNDEIALLANALDNTSESLSIVLGEIQDNAESLAAASEEMSAVSTQLASGSEEMSSQAMTIAGATEQMSANIKSVDDAANIMNNNSKAVSGAATQIAENMNNDFHDQRDRSKHTESQ